MPSISVCSTVCLYCGCFLSTDLFYYFIMLTLLLCLVSLWKRKWPDSLYLQLQVVKLKEGETSLSLRIFSVLVLQVR